ALDLTRLSFRREAHVDLAMSLSGDNVRSSSAVDHSDVQSNSRSCPIDGVKLFGLSSEFEYRARPFLRLEPRVCGPSFHPDREHAGSLAPGFHTSAGRGRFHHKRVL